MRLFIQVICFVVLMPLNAFAISETDYAANYQTSVLPFFETGHAGRFPGQRNVMLSYIGFDHPQARGIIVVAPGYNESTRKYAEVAYDLYAAGYSVYVLDHRGEGASDRFLKNPHMGYVDHFQNFVADLKTFTDTIVPAGHRYLLAHSLGGAIGASYLENYRQDFRAAVLTSPMLEINLGQAEWLATPQLLALELAGKAREYAPGVGDYDPAQVPFETNTLTHSRVRFDGNTQILVSHPDLFLAGQTVHWILEAIHGSSWARNKGWRVSTPVLVFQAGQDAIVKPGGQNKFCRAAGNCQLTTYAGANHEILQETDAIRGPALQKILDFFQAH